MRGACGLFRYVGQCGFGHIVKGYGLDSEYCAVEQPVYRACPFRRDGGTSDYHAEHRAGRCAVAVGIKPALYGKAYGFAKIAAAI